jgi:hypothetical protein|tara:strand:+ start:15437 stop:16147 length:711 start_codon:yes stop_codon:yes gene_type:complete
LNSLFKLAALLTLVVPAVSLSALVSGADAAAPAAPPGPALSFRVERGSTPIGTHTVSFMRKGEELHVAVDIELAVSFGPITVFRYEHRNRETWRGGKLVALETVTNDNGTRYKVSAKAMETGLKVISSANGTFIAPDDIIPTSYWNPATISQSELLDTQKGRILKVEIKPGTEFEAGVNGKPIPVREYEMTGDLKLKLWYSPEMEWLNVIFRARGEDVDYRVVRIDRQELQQVARQ